MSDISARAILSADGKTFTLKVGSHKGTHPIEKLDDWIKTYEGLRDRKSKVFGGQPFKPHYARTVEVLQKIKAKVEGSPS